ncbi:MAG TPA: nuclear transport factor 2 family protein [Solirubrobacteraceae bacterium]|nr:nuclear transport factor 2 family protein [Solirubrobacteraceae bacterium]
MPGKTTLESFYAAMDSGDIPGALELLDAEIEWVEAQGFPYGGTYHGPDAVLNGVFARLGSEWDGFRADVDYVVGDGERAVGVGAYSGTYKATGKAFSARFAHSIVARDGKLVSFEQIVDSAQVNVAL